MLYVKVTLAYYVCTSNFQDIRNRMLPVIYVLAVYKLYVHELYIERARLNSAKGLRKCLLSFISTNLISTKFFIQGYKRSPIFTLKAQALEISVRKL